VCSHLLRRRTHSAPHLADPDHGRSHSSLPPSHTSRSRACLPHPPLPSSDPTSPPNRLCPVKTAPFCCFFFAPYPSTAPLLPSRRLILASLCLRLRSHPCRLQVLPHATCDLRNHRDIHAACRPAPNVQGKLHSRNRSALIPRSDARSNSTLRRRRRCFSTLACAVSSAQLDRAASALQLPHLNTATRLGRISPRCSRVSRCRIHFSMRS